MQVGQKSQAEKEESKEQEKEVRSLNRFCFWGKKGV